jgi:hypothetical protein
MRRLQGGACIDGLHRSRKATALTQVTGLVDCARPDVAMKRSAGKEEDGKGLKI